MAEIRVERKKGIPVWVILLALIALAVAAWYLLGRDDQTGATQDVAVHTLAVEAAEALPLALCA